MMLKIKNNFQHLRVSIGYLFFPEKKILNPLVEDFDGYYRGRLSSEFQAVSQNLRGKCKFQEGQYREGVNFLKFPEFQNIDVLNMGVPFVLFFSNLKNQICTYSSYKKNSIYD